MKHADIAVLRLIHTIFALYFLCCLLYLYYAGIYGHFDVRLAIAVISLLTEGILVFVINNGDCPLIHIQRSIGDTKPFFELFFPPRVAKQAIPIFAKFTVLGIAILMIRLLALLMTQHSR